MKTVPNTFKRVHWPETIIRILEEEARRRGISFDRAACEALSRCIHKEGK